MPLRSGKSRAVISHNISQLIREGYEPRRAIAASYSKAGISRKDKKPMAKKKRKSAKHHHKHKRRSSKKTRSNSALARAYRAAKAAYHKAGRALRKSRS